RGGDAVGGAGGVGEDEALGGAEVQRAQRPRQGVDRGAVGEDQPAAAVVEGDVGVGHRQACARDEQAGHRNRGGRGRRGRQLDHAVVRHGGEVGGVGDVVGEGADRDAEEPGVGGEVGVVNRGVGQDAAVEDGGGRRGRGEEQLGGGAVEGGGAAEIDGRALL